MGRVFSVAAWPPAMISCAVIVNLGDSQSWRQSILATVNLAPTTTSGPRACAKAHLPQLLGEARFIIVGAIGGAITDVVRRLAIGVVKLPGQQRCPRPIDNWKVVGALEGAPR
jgi:hypothetical protein